MFKMSYSIGVLKLILIQYMIGDVSSLLNSGETGGGRAGVAADGLGQPVANRRHTDNLLIARCRSKCTNTNDKMMCEGTCIRDYLENSSYKKYGDCPRDPQNRLEAICLDTCQSTDYHCPGVEKCCPHSCGMSCQSPIGFSKVRGLPPVPVHVVLRDAGRSIRLAEIQWDLSMEEEDSSATYYVVESRHHIGISFAERKMENDWQNHKATMIYEIKQGPGNLKRFVGELKLKPGRWYQVRVAAVNEKGTRGYSVISKEFQLSRKPNPPQPPKNLTLGPLVPGSNGLYSRKIMWGLPRSDLPVEKYKISWSLYLNASGGARTGNSSLFKEMATVSAPTRHYEIKGLHPNSIYYLQIHAVSVYGKRRLKSAACNELMNTTVDPANHQSVSMDNMLMNDASYQRRTKSGGSAPGLNHKFFVRKSGLMVRITWSDRNASGRYRLHLCRGTRECLSKPMGANSHDVVVKQKTSYEFSSLEFDTKYTVGLRHNHRKRVPGSTAAQHHRPPQPKVPPGYDSFRTFVTPKCEQFRKAHPHLSVECSV